MESGEFRKVEITHDGQWQSARGLVHQLCIGCELSTRKSSVESSTVFLGMSLCLAHLHIANGLLNNGYTEQYIVDLIRKGRV